MQKITQMNPGSFFKILMIIFLFLLVSCKKDGGDILQPWYPETNTNNDPVSGVFESRIPCDGCERLKFALAIYKNPQTGLPTTYVMSRIYVGDGNDRVTNSGNISITQGTTLNPLHTVYQLTTGAPTEYHSFWKIDENLLFILDNNLAPRVGDAGYGYVLNRVR